MLPGMLAWLGSSRSSFAIKCALLKSAVDAAASIEGIRRCEEMRLYCSPLAFFSSYLIVLGKMLVSFLDRRSPSYICLRLRRKFVSK